LLPINPFLAQHHKICGAVPIFAPIMLEFIGIGDKSTNLHHKRQRDRTVSISVFFQFIRDHYYLLFQGEVTIARVSGETQKINNKFSHLIAAFEMHLIGERGAISKSNRRRELMRLAGRSVIHADCSLSNVLQLDQYLRNNNYYAVCAGARGDSRSLALSSCQRCCCCNPADSA